MIIIIGVWTYLAPLPSFVNDYDVYKVKALRVVAMEGDERCLVFFCFLCRTRTPDFSGCVCFVPIGCQLETTAWQQCLLSPDLKGTHTFQTNCFLTTKDLASSYSQTKHPRTMCTSSQGETGILFVTICNVGYCCCIVPMELLFTMYEYKMHIAINLMFTLYFDTLIVFNS